MTFTLLAQPGIDWSSLLSTSGLAVVILFAIAIAGWRVAKYFAAKVIEPIVARALKFFDDLDTRIDARMDRLESKLDKIKITADTVTITHNGGPKGAA